MPLAVKIMKSATPILAQAFLASSAAAFTACPASSSRAVKPQRTRPLHATMTADELDGMSRSEQLKVLGVEESKLAMGIDPDEVLEFIGT